MVTVRKNTFVKSIELPANNPMLDGNQFSGEGLKFLKSSCPRPLATGTGEAYCALSCVNSCPERNPDVKDNAGEQLAYQQSYQPFVDGAISTATTALNAQTSTVSIAGETVFAIPDDASADVLASVIELIENELPNNVPYPLQSLVCACDDDMLSI
jgi:hypothetical protein